MYRAELILAVEHTHRSTTIKSEVFSLSSDQGAYYEIVRSSLSFNSLTERYVDVNIVIARVRLQLMYFDYRLIYVAPSGMVFLDRLIAEVLM